MMKDTALKPPFSEVINSGSLSFAIVVVLSMEDRGSSIAVIFSFFSEKLSWEIVKCRRMKTRASQGVLKRSEGDKRIFRNPSLC